MNRRKKWEPVYFVLLALTLAFAGALFLAARREGAVPPGGAYTVAAERDAPDGEEPDAAVWMPLDVNSATAEELEELMGIGPALAQAIVDYSEANGPFASVDELLEVSGIGEAKLSAIRDDVTAGKEGNG